MHALKPWQRAIAAVALLKSIAAVGLYLATFGLSDRILPRDAVYFAQVLAYAGAALLLFSAGRRDYRAVVLAVAFTLTAAVFADNAPLAFEVATGRTSLPMVSVFALQVDAFTAYFLWLFISEFPRSVAFGPRYRVAQYATNLALGLGVALFALNTLYFAFAHFTTAEGLRVAIRPLTREDERGAYWTLQYAVAFIGLPTLIWKARASSIAERRRVTLLIGAIVLGVAPTVAWVLASVLSQPFHEAVPLRLAGWVLYPTLLSLPFFAAYAVLVHRALNAQLIIRRAIQYAFARYTLLTAAAIPFLILGMTLYQNRDRALSQVFEGTRGTTVALLLALAVGMWIGRRAVIDRIDRQFFREQYDSRKILSDLVDECRTATSREQLAERLRRDIDRALHLDAIYLLTREDSGDVFHSVTRDIRPLHLSGELKIRLSRPEPVEIDFEQTSFESLTEDERTWLGDAGARLLVAIHDAKQHVHGLLVLGEKKSELPYSREDKMVLSTVASAASLAMTRPELRTDEPGEVIETGSRRTDGGLCVACGMVAALSAGQCPRCGSALSELGLPRLLAGKFELLERIGEGGMGVVYRGRDLALGRAVALKTLPRMSIRRAARMRREARAMAAIAHQHLAMIYGAESWNGMPILVVEHLPGDTLAARIARCPLGRRETLEVGVAMADVVRALHSVALLHRDIKPSNIAFTADGVPKLLDFGLARLLANEDDFLRSGEYPALASARLVATNPVRTESLDGALVGTPLYLSPEALAGEMPDASFDLWSLNIVLFEALTGVNPIREQTINASLHRIATGNVRRLHEVAPGADADLAEFFARSLSADKTQRPASAAELRDHLARLLDATPPAYLEPAR